MRPMVIVFMVYAVFLLAEFIWRGLNFNIAYVVYMLSIFSASLGYLGFVKKTGHGEAREESKRILAHTAYSSLKVLAVIGFLFFLQYQGYGISRLFLGKVLLVYLVVLGLEVWITSSVR